MPKDHDQGLPNLRQRAREYGFVRLPPLFVKMEDVAAIHALANQYLDEINEIRDELSKQHEKQMQALQKTKEDYREAGFDPLAVDWPGMN